ncbi:hypothetical protein GGX14DRAFT_570844 [Mycena pura]|uniref:Uncharacterized protein n=1 Tax=Mycena pura TaxID=153505 RepID=A0AAD6YCG7_9AGAR|nr:hypothetical protein GGX14DRAFT_570844 [Mycena pura]
MSARRGSAFYRNSLIRNVQLLKGTLPVVYRDRAPAAPPRRVTIRLDSYDGSHPSFCGEEKEIRGAFPTQRTQRDHGLLVLE